MATNVILFIKLIISLLLSFTLTVFITKKIIKISLKRNDTQIEREYLQNHIDKKGTPTMGGIAIVLSSLLTFFTINIGNSLSTDIKAVILGFVCFFLIGFIDDYLKVKIKTYDGLKAGIRIMLEIVVSLYVILILKDGGYSLNKIVVPVVNGIINTTYLFIPFILIVIIGSSNAINLSDGLDGLASGLVMICLTPFILISILHGNYELTLLLVSVVGSLIGFLFFNFHPAKIFMGDCGSLALGALLGVSSIVLHSEIILVVAGILFVLEAFSVILQVCYYKLTHKRIFLMAPLHHHFEKKGWAEWKVVMMFYLIGCFASLLAIIIEVI